MTPVRLHLIAVSSDLQLSLSTPVADPDVQIRGEGAGAGAGGHPDPEIRGGGQSPKKVFSALQTSVWSKNQGGAGPRAPPLNPPLHNGYPGDRRKWLM